MSFQNQDPEKVAEDAAVLAWLGVPEDEALYRADSMLRSYEGLPEWLMPTNTVEIEEVQESDALPDWREPHRLSDDEREIEPSQEQRDLVSKGLHVLTDERRIAALSLIGMNPQGLDGYELAQRYRKLGFGYDFPREHVDAWFVGNGLATIDYRMNGGVRHMSITEEGQALLPFAGHLLDWVVNLEAGNVRDYLDNPSDAQLNGNASQSLGRKNFEQLSYIFANPSQLLRQSEIMEVSQAAEGHTRGRIARMVKNGIIIAVPGPVQPAENYPVFEPQKFYPSWDKPHDTRTALIDYIIKSQETSPGPMSLYELVYHRQYIPISKRAGGYTEFAREVFQHYAALRTAGHLVETVPSKIKFHQFAVNPAALPILQNLVHLVRGAEANSDSYQISGLQKLAQHLASSGTRLREVAQTALDKNRQTKN